MGKVHHKLLGHYEYRGRIQEEEHMVRKRFMGKEVEQEVIIRV